MLRGRGWVGRLTADLPATDDVLNELLGAGVDVSGVDVPGAVDVRVSTVDAPQALKAVVAVISTTAQNIRAGRRGAR